MYILNSVLLFSGDLLILVARRFLSVTCTVYVAIIIDLYMFDSQSLVQIYIMTAVEIVMRIYLHYSFKDLQSDVFEFLTLHIPLSLCRPQ